MLILLLGLMWNSSHLNATVITVYGLEATDQSLKLLHSNSTTGDQLWIS